MIQPPVASARGGDGGHRGGFGGGGFHGGGFHGGFDGGGFRGGGFRGRGFGGYGFGLYYGGYYPYAYNDYYYDYDDDGGCYLVRPRGRKYLTARRPASMNLAPSASVFFTAALFPC